MTKFSCAACKIEEHGIKTRVAVEHTCAKADKNYKEPEFIICPVEGKKYKVYYHKLLFGSSTGMKYSIVRTQYLNGYKVPPGATMWILHTDCSTGNDHLAHPFIWVKEKAYKQLAFV